VQGIKKKEFKTKGTIMRKGNMDRKSTNQGHDMKMNGRNVKLV
jgi:hypothetical protein